MKQYVMGLDIGTASTGWAAITPQNILLRAKGHNLIGVRLFDPADTAQSRRMQRTTRRRIARRRWRLRMLNALFDAELNKVDPAFLARRKYSWVHEQDEQNADHYYGGILFGTADEIANHADAEFYKKYPTIYHLRYTLMYDDAQHDIREIYLAVHHIVKYRGHFLIEGPIQSSKLFDPKELVELVAQILPDLLESDIPDDAISRISMDQLHQAVLNTQGSKSQRADEIAAILLKLVDSKDRVYKNAVTAIAKALVGLTANLDSLFVLSGLTKDDKNICKINYTDAQPDEKIETLTGSGIFSESQLATLQTLYDIVQAAQLAQLLGKHSSISEAMCAQYDKHKANLQAIRSTVNDCDSAEERTIMRHTISTYYRAVIFTHIKNNLNTDDLATIKGIATTPAKLNKLADTIKQYIVSSSLDEATKTSLLEDIDNERIFPVQRSSANGVIPHQLHLNELRQIINRQSQYYPFLKDSVEIDGKKVTKLEALMKFRVPYYVGPLVDPKDMPEHENSAYHWMQRKSPGAITPWNFDEKVDRDKSAEQFIRRLVGTDTYLLGEETLPQNSLLYQEYNLLNELNNVRVTTLDGLGLQETRHLSYEEKQHLIEECFLQRATVTRKQAESTLSKYAGRSVEISGLADEHKFVSSLSSFLKLRSILGSDFVANPQNRETLEEIIKLQTIFEDQAMLKKQLAQLSTLDENKVSQLSKNHYTGWGKLSRKLLTSHIAIEQLQDDVLPTRHSIIEIMRGTDKNFMQIITNSKYGIQDWIDQQNNLWLQEQPEDNNNDIQPYIDQLRVSGKVKRGIIQALAVIDDVTKAVGNPPSQIFVELADDVQASVRTRSRKARITDIYSRIFIENPAVKQELALIKKQLDKCAETQLQDDRLYLYFLQEGKDAYTGKPIDINDLSSRYDIDHIIPQSVTVDNSIDNRVLVARTKNASKSAQAIETQQIPAQARALWKKLFASGLMSRTKYERLTGGSEYWKKHRGRFIARSLVETRQIMKNVCTILRARYGEQAVIGLPSTLTSDMRRFLGYNHKNRDINELHHAQDALCIAAAGQFIYRRKWVDREGFTPDASKSFMTYLDRYKQEYRTSITEPNPEQKHTRAYGFVVGSMQSDREELRIDPDTREIIWSESDTAYLREVMNYKTMLVTYKSGDNIQSLYKETRWSPIDKNKLIAFDKKHTNTSLYGGFSEEHTACMVLVDDKKVRLLNILVSEYEAYTSCSNSQERLDWLRTQKNLSNNARLLLDHIALGQVLEWHKSGTAIPALVLIKSASEFNNARQLWLDRTTYNYIDMLSHTDDEQEVQHHFKEAYHVQNLAQCMSDIFTKLLHISAAYYPSYGVNESNTEQAVEKFAKLPFEEQKKVLSGMILALHSGPGRADLKKVGLGSACGRMNNNSGFTLSDQDTFIFQSPSGLFTKRVSVKQLRQHADNRAHKPANNDTRKN